MSEFTERLKLLLSKTEEPPRSTDSSELDDLVGMIRRGTFYLFNGEKELIEILFRYLIVIALRLREGSVVIMLCMNYWKERAELGTDALMEFIEYSGYGMECEPGSSQGDIQAPRGGPPAPRST